MKAVILSNGPSLKLWSVEDILKLKPGYVITVNAAIEHCPQMVTHACIGDHNALLEYSEEVDKREILLITNRDQYWAALMKATTPLGKVEITRIGIDAIWWGRYGISATSTSCSTAVKVAARLEDVTEIDILGVDMGGHDHAYGALPVGPFGVQGKNRWRKEIPLFEDACNEVIARNVVVNRRDKP